MLSVQFYIEIVASAIIFRRTINPFAPEAQAEGYQTDYIAHWNFKQ